MSLEFINSFIIFFSEKNESFYCDRLKLKEGEELYIGFGSQFQNIIMILFSFLGIFINLYFFISSIKRILDSKKLNNINLSSIEKILCVISITETCISICWLINSFKMKTTKELIDNCNVCRIIGNIELFFYIFDWMILSSTLYQIKQILSNPLETLKTGKIVIRYILFCLIFGIFNVFFGFYADVEGVSPMLTCFVDVVGWDYEGEEKVDNNIFYIMFFLIPICILLFGIYLILEIIKLPQYKNNQKNKKFFKSYLVYILTYIILALLLISVYIFDYFINQKQPSGIMKIYVNIVTMLSCSTPLIVGTIRLIKTKLIKKLFFCNFNNKINNNNIDYLNNIELNEEKIISKKINNDYKFLEFEQEIICKEFKKIFIGISYILDKSINNEEENNDKKEKNEESVNLINENENDNDNYYMINKEEILKDFDLEINDDIFVLDQEEINIEAIEFCPKFFKNIRKSDYIKENLLVKYFQPKNVNPNLFKKINDSNYYINSTNKQFILRSITLDKINFYKTNLKKGKINEYLIKNNDSIINRVYGLYNLKIDNNKNYYIALMENIYESMDENLFSYSNNNNINESNNNNELNDNLDLDSLKSDVNNEKIIYLSENEINEKIVNSDNDGDIYGIPRSKSVKKIISLNENKIFLDKKFKINLNSNEFNRLKIIIQKDIDFLHSIGANKLQFLVVQKIISNNMIKLINNKNNEEENNNKFIGNKKYIFKSSIDNIIYYITISDYFSFYSN